MTDRIDERKMDMFDEARAIRSTMELCHLTQGELARQLGVSQSYVANKLRLLKFSQKMTEKIRSSGISERHARALLRLIESDTDTPSRTDCKTGTSAEPRADINTEPKAEPSVKGAKTAAAEKGGIKDKASEKNEARAERVLAKICDRSLTVRESEALIETELVRALPHRLAYAASALDGADTLHTAIRSACTTLRSQGIDARARTTYLGTDLYITVVIKGV